jgi:hypothetical protein
MNNDERETHEIQDELINDVLLALLVFDVENKGEWMGTDILKLKGMYGSDKHFKGLLDFLKEKGYIKVREEKGFSYVQITQNGRSYLMEKI